MKAGGSNTELQNLQGADMSLLSLRFRDPRLEAHFKTVVVRRALPVVRLYMWIGVLSYVVFGALDLIMLGEQAFAIIKIRLLFSAGLLGCTLAAYSRYVEQFFQIILFLVITFAAGGILTMLMFLNPPYSYMYYVGIILVFIWCTNLVVLSYYLYASMATAIVVLYALISNFINPLPDWVLINNIFFLSTTVAWTIWTSYWQETYSRHVFATRHLLEAEKAKAETLLEAARAGNRSKSEFLAVMSHELRTPLNAIIGFSEIMRNQLYGPIGSEKYAAYVEDISDSGNHLLRVINDILDLSKAEAGKLEIYEDEVDIVQLVHNTLRMFREKASEAGISLVFDEPSFEPILWADSRLVKQLLINLVSNAVKFTPTGGTVTISVKVTPGNDCEIAVADTGIGLKESDIPRVLEPFVQVESALSRKNGGTGLGLPLVKRIVERHDGIFELTSALGKGTTARAIFPGRRIMSQQIAQRTQQAQ